MKDFLGEVGRLKHETKHFVGGLRKATHPEQRKELSCATNHSSSPLLQEIREHALHSGMNSSREPLSFLLFGQQGES